MEGWEEEKVQQAAKRYDDDDRGKDVGSRLLLLVAAIVAVRTLPPQPMARRRGTGRKLSQLCFVQIQMDTNLHAFFSLYKVDVLCRGLLHGYRVQGVGSFRSLSAHSDSALVIS